MSDHGTVIGPRAVRFERMLPGPIERVWAYLTEPDKRATWFAGGEMELRVGGRVAFRFHHADFAPPDEPVPERFEKYRDAVIDSPGVVTRCEAPRLLVFEWGEEDGSSSEVTFELEPVGERARLVLTHRRLADRAAMIGVSGGWHGHLAVLADVLAEGRACAFWSVIDRAEADYEKRYPME